MSERSYAAVLTKLYALAPRGIHLGLEPVRVALAHFGNPQDSFRVIHIAGTNGKGSTSAIVERALRAAGRTTGLYTSPHLHRFAERIRINGAPCENNQVQQSLERVFDGLESNAIDPLTFFEATTVAAWLCFHSAGVQDVVLEVGLGGRLDSTNVCVPTVCAITRIALDHQAFLGDTLALIASEKAGIIKLAIPVVLGPSLHSGEAREAIELVATQQHAPIVDAAVLAFSSDHCSSLVTLPSPAEGEPSVEVKLSLAGAHQVENAATACTILRTLLVPQMAIVEALRDASWPARYERIENVVIDAAHNPDGALALRNAIEQELVPSDRRAVVFGASQDKDWPELVNALRDWAPADRWFLCAAGLSRAADPALLRTKIHGEICSGVVDALTRARHVVGKDGLVVVFGSIFVGAEARAHLLGLTGDPLVGL